MSSPRIHRVTSSDGVTIAGAVHGDGPPLVFLQGVIGDGDLDWDALTPRLSCRFTCHLPSWRGRGRSGDHPDLGFPRLVDDVLEYVESLGEPTGLVGWSAGAGLALAAAPRSDAVTAAALLEPLTPTRMETHEKAALGGAVARMAELATEGRPTEGITAFAGFVFSDEEIAAIAGYLEAAGRYVPSVLSFFQQQREYRGPTHEDAALLRSISAPVLVLVGSDAKPYAVSAARYVADQLPNARIREIPGAGHAAPLTHPAALAGDLPAFFASPG